MTQKEKELLLKDLCARLPYGVKGINENAIISSPKDWKTEYTLEFALLYRIEKYNWRPYLFPLSSMTEEQKEEYVSLQQRVIYNSQGLVNLDVMEYTAWCYNNHIDINGLIPMGLALDATGLNIY